MNSSKSHQFFFVNAESATTMFGFNLIDIEVD